MNLTPDMYVPSLRWRAGEYQALFRLDSSAKGRVVPFIVVPEVEFDFELRRPKKTVQEHVAPFPTKYHQKWANLPAWVDVHPKIILERMDSGKLPIEHIFDELHALGSSAVPVTSLDASAEVNAGIATITEREGCGVGLRARLEHLMKPNFAALSTELLAAVRAIPAEADLIIDLGAPNYEPYEDFAAGLTAAFENIDNITTYRSFVLIGSAYPEVIAFDKPGGSLPRHDWEFFKVLRTKLNGISRVPNFGDYTVVHPKFTPRDMRMIKSGSKLIYTSGMHWIIRKGGALRGNPEQMHGHCEYILKSGEFRGPTFSSGDDYIEKCANRKAKPSNQTFWKQVAINHHIMHVLEDLSR